MTGTVLQPAATGPVDVEIKTSYSAITEHRACPQKWFYSRVMRLEAAEGVPVERDFGSWWHALRAAEAIQRGGDEFKFAPDRLYTTDNGPIISTDGVEPLDVLAAASRWWDSQPNLVKDEWLARLGPLVERLSYTFDRWSERWAQENQQQTPLAVELRWERALSLGGNGNASMLLRGVVDEVYWDAERNMIVVRDHKTHKVLATQTAADDMMDSQLQLYAWGATPLIVEWGMGQPRATAYDRARMTAPKQPVVTKAGALSKSVTDYDLHTYRAWVDEGVQYPGLKADGSGAGTYNEEPSVVERLSSPASQSIWFQRTLVPLNRNLIATHLRAARDSALSIMETRERADREGEAARNLSKNCRWCDFASLCRAQMMGGPEGEYPLVDHGLRVRT